MARHENGADDAVKRPRVEDYFRLLFDEAPCYISVQDRNLRIVESNRRFKEAFGDRAEARCYELYKCREAPCVHCPVAATFEDGESHQSREVVTSRSGRRIDTLVTTAPICGSSDEIDFVMELSTDITEVRALQERLTNLGLLVGSLSHSLRGLLMGLQGGTYLLKTGIAKQKTERVEEGAQMIERNVESVCRVVLDLMYIAGESQAPFVPVDLVELASEVTRRRKKLAADLEIDFQVEVRGDVGLCEVDSRALSASLMNVLDIAFEACRKKKAGRPHFVRLRLSSDGDDAIFEIEDNGAPHDQAALERVLSPSLAIGSASDTNPKLFAATKVIERHRGIMDVESHPDCGTSYRIRIPRVQPR
jgi:signal transduction histidine kinase